MTQNQIGWQRAMEEIRHNKVMETEANRHNLAAEQQAALDYGETVRSHQANEQRNSLADQLAYQAQMASAGMHAAATRYAAGVSASASRYAASQHAAASRYAADSNRSNTIDTNRNRMNIAAMQNTTSRYAVDRNAAASKYGADQGFAGAKYGADSHLIGTGIQTVGRLAGSIAGAY